MALDSSSPFGSSKSRTLYGDTSPEVEPFTFPSSGLSTVYNSSNRSNSVLSDSHSTSNDENKFIINPCVVKHQDQVEIASITTEDKADDEAKSENENVPAKSDSKESSEHLRQDKRSPETSQHTEMKETTTEEFVKPSRNYEEKNTANADIESEMSESEDVVECANCDNEFQTLQEYMDHSCAGKSKSADSKMNVRLETIPVEKKDLSDVESFDGKIVYNTDGSAYIIEGDSDSEIESFIDLPRKEGMIVDKKGIDSSVPSQNEFPQIDNAFFVPRNPNSLLNNAYLVPHQKSLSTPIMHSYRVFDMRSRKEKSENSGDILDDKNTNAKSPSSADTSTSKVSLSPLSSSMSSSIPTSSALDFLSPYVTSVPTKPILMCFICKLSFGFAKSFTSHAITEHSMDLSEEEKDIMSRKNSSAIIQGIGKEKDPLMSFLEPIKSSKMENRSKSHSPIKTLVNSCEKVTNTAKDTTSVSYVYTKPKLSDSCNTITNSQTSPDAVKDLSIHDIRSQIEKKMFDNDSNSVSIPNTLPNHFESKSERSEAPESKRIRLETSDDSNSQSSFQMNPVQRFLQDQDYSSQSPKSFLPAYASPQRAGFYGICEEHPNGRAAGVECPSCDMVLSSSQSLGGHMTMMHSRNSCKTLKCPKCNWHYKYQETLEIHMKEKHPEGDQKCMYCLTNQTHPRLARGESYSCGYKPYRCEVCNYSTTTKGNLSIHMQSDKHLNNVQDLANSGGDLQQFNKHQQQMAAAAAASSSQQQQQHQPPPQLPTPTHLSPASAIKTPPHQQMMQQQQHHHHHSHQQQPSQLRQDDSAKKAKPKPTWRCDVCNYETNVARNLRIHMTSEKHTHNMMVLQQNMKHMRRDMEIHHMNQLVMLHQDPSFLGLSGPVPGGITFPYDGSLMMSGVPAGFGDSPVDLSKENDMNANGTDLQDVSRLFQCCVCNIFGTDSLESLHQHLQMDRTKVHENDNISVASGTYMCNLCQYKTTLKANFQLHCKTDKHIQRLQLVNHIKEGGANNEWRLKYLNVSNPVQVRCNCCDYYTNSIHKLQIHTGNPRHEASAQLFCHLQNQESLVAKKEQRSYYCSLCKFNSRSKLGLMQHVHSVQHLHSEGLKQLEMKEKGQMEVDIGEIFMVKEVQDLKAIKFDDESSAPVSSKLQYAITSYILRFSPQ